MTYYDTQTGRPAGMTEVERARVRVMTEDTAARWYQMFGDAQTVVRYVAETLGPLITTYGIDRVKIAVGETLDEDPEILTRTPQRAAEAQEGRHALCKGKEDSAAEAVREGRYEDALRIIEDAERIDPDYLVGGVATWANVRANVERLATTTR